MKIVNNNQQDEYLGKLAIICIHLLKNINQEFKVNKLPPTDKNDSGLMIFCNRHKSSERNIKVWKCVCLHCLQDRFKKKFI